MRSIEQLGKNLTGLALFIAISAAGAQCVLANTLSEVQINAADTGYAVVLKTESSAQMKKVISSPNKMYIELKNVQAAEGLSTVYNDVANIDNITIQPVSKDDLKITLQGEGISASKIYFESAKTLPVVQQGEESIELSAPVSTYKPVYHRTPEQVDQTASPRVNSILTKMHVDRNTVLGMKDFAKTSLKNTNILIPIAILMVVAAFMFRPNRKSKVKSPLQMGLSASSRSAQIERELGIAKGLASTPIAQQQPATLANYGMKAYQNSQKNPYMTNNLAEHNSIPASRPGVSGIPRKSTLAPRKPMSAPKPVQRQTAPSTKINMQNPIDSMPARPSNAANIDSVRFLESITKIYEKNGRTDLAKGLKDNLKRAQMAH